MGRIAGWIANALLERGVVDEEEAEICRYGFACHLAELVFWAVLAGLSIWLHCLPGIICFVLGFLPVKRDIGGRHLYSHRVCLAVSTAMPILWALLARRVAAKAQLALAVCLLAAALALVFRLAPVPHPNHPQTPEELLLHRWRGRRNATLFCGLVLAGFALLPPPLLHLPLSGGCGLFAAAATLPIPNRKEESA